MHSGALQPERTEELSGLGSEVRGLLTDMNTVDQGTTMILHCHVPIQVGRGGMQRVTGKRDEELHKSFGWGQLDELRREGADRPVSVVVHKLSVIFPASQLREQIELRGRQCDVRVTLRRRGAREGSLQRFRRAQPHH